MLYHRYLNANLHGYPVSEPEPPVLLPPNFRRAYLRYAAQRPKPQPGLQPD